jgi:glucosamine--fructose-6-phosphate aminotransferase (isomerizing)
VCGIVACRRAGEALDYLIPGLRRLEYRGYDSAGVAVASAGALALQVRRSMGRLAALEQTMAEEPLEPGGVGVGHTRWATHGKPTEANAHPHRDCSGSVVVVHNGIIENATKLRAELEATGHVIETEVDTEVIAHLVEDARSDGLDLGAAVRRAIGRLQGSWALAVMADGYGGLVVARHRSPLVLAEGGDGVYVGSDITALLGWAESVHVLADGDVVEIDEEARWFSACGDRRPVPPAVRASWSAQDADRGAFEDFMEKEIAEQPEVAARLLDQLLPGATDGRWWDDLGLAPFQRVQLIACGTSLHAAALTGHVLREVGRFPTQLVVASEHESFLREPGTLTIAFSQSGETADVLAALDATAGPVLAVTNVGYSSIARRADAIIDCMAGPEIGVAATKTFVAQILAGAVFGLAAAAAYGRADLATLGSLTRALGDVPRNLQTAVLLAEPTADALVCMLARAEGFLFVSRGSGLPYAWEGALKLKEITYRWAEAYAAGELKHGPIALLEEGTPVVVIESGNADKLEANIAEMRARGARIVRIGRGPQATFPLSSTLPAAPWGPIESAPALQHLARSLAVRLGRDVDKPRNLAKSVTVE